MQTDDNLDKVDFRKKYEFASTKKAPKNPGL